MRCFIQIMCRFHSVINGRVVLVFVSCAMYIVVLTI